MSGFPGWMRLARRNEMLAAGWTISEVAAVENVPVDTVYRWARRNMPRHSVEVLVDGPMLAALERQWPEDPPHVSIVRLVREALDVRPG